MLSVKKLLYKVLTNFRVMSIQHDQSATLTNGVFRLTVPNGFNTNDIIIIQPVYNSGGTTVAWSVSVQPASSTVYNVYVREGASLATGSIKYNAVFIKR